MKLLVNCDQVFDVLTRGPFPTGNASDEAVEQHLRACHDCRRLAEALRPAVALLHEAVGSEQALSLPEYQGTLPLPALDDSSDDSPYTNPKPRSLSLGLRRLDCQPLPPPKPPFDYAQLINGMRLLAASVLVVALGTLAWGLLMSARHDAAVADGPGRPKTPMYGVSPDRPDERGLRSLMALQLTTVCFRPGDRLAAAALARTPLTNALDAGEALTCCTHCHAPGKPAATHLVAANVRFTQSCSACHRG